MYFHAVVGYLVQSTWLKAIVAGNYESWPGLTLANAKRFCPSVDETIKGHMVQESQGRRSLQIRPRSNSAKKRTQAEDASDQFERAGYRAKQEQPDKNDPAPGSSSANELHVKVHQSKLYTDDTGRFPA